MTCVAIVAPELNAVAKDSPNNKGASVLSGLHTSQGSNGQASIAPGHWRRQPCAGQRLPAVEHKLHRKPHGKH